MKIGSILTAIAVALILYGVVFERDRLMSFAGRQPAPDTAVTDADTATEPDSAGSASAQPSDAASNTAGRPVSVVAIDSISQVVDNAVVLRGQTEAARIVEVQAQADGLVISEPLRKGAQVSAGQLLCQIEEGTRPAQLAQAEAQLEEAKLSQNAAARLAEGGYTSETARAAADAALEAAQASVAAAKIQINRLNLYAPFGGLLETDTAEIGSLMQAGALCATIVDLNPIKIVAYLPETAVGKVKVGAAATANLSSGEDVEGTVTFVSRSADPNTRTFQVDITVPNPDLSIRDGLSANISIAVDGEESHNIPPSALTLDDNGTMGLKLVDQDDRVMFAPVRILRDTPDGALVSGLPEEARIIVVGQEYVNDGVPVNVTLRGDG
ncbi:MAG: efflux RND transporter periplasmic adaptor subunit [Pseudomonadota bacterium]